MDYTVQRMGRSGVQAAHLFVLKETGNWELVKRHPVKLMPDDKGPHAMSLPYKAAHLLAERVPGRYGFHDLLRGYAAELTNTRDSDTERQTAIRRMLDHYVHTAASGAVVLESHRGSITLAAAVIFGVVSAAVGYYVSWVEQLPTGASMVVVASAFLLPGLVKILRRNAV